VIFTSPSGGLLRHSNFYRRVWLPALTATTLPGVHIHDLRHAGNVLIANAGADPRELMERMGHSTSRAALIYLHSTSARQRELAETVASRVRSELARSASCGTGAARPPARPEWMIDLDLAAHALSWLFGWCAWQVRLAGFEPATRCLEGTFGL
jgi:hypothetical protein